MVRVADLKRGWGKYFSKSCKAKAQSRSGGSRNYYRAKKYREAFGGNPQFGTNGDYEGLTLSQADMSEGNVQ